MVELVRRLQGYLKPYWRYTLAAPLLMIVEVAMDLLQPQFIKHIIDDGIGRGDMTVVWHTGLAMIGCALVGLLAGAGCGWMAVLSGLSFGTDLRAGVFRKVQEFSFGNLDEMETGGLMTRLTSDITQTQNAVMLLLRGMIRMPLLLVGSLFMAVWTSPRLGVIYLALIPVVLVSVVWITRRTYPLYGKVQARLDALNTVLRENLAGVRVVRVFARAAREVERFAQANFELMLSNITSVRFSALTMPVMMLTLNSCIVATLWLGGHHVKSGELQVGQVVAFVNYLMQTLMSMLVASFILIQLSRARASAVRIVEVLETAPGLPTASAPVALTAAQGRIEFENVNFSYNPHGHDPVLKNLHFVAEPGQTLAIVGATGSGKSSLVQLIPRFYDVTQGSVKLDGRDVRSLVETELRQQVGIALQESILFSGTIRENIIYGRPDASEEDVIAAARAAQAEEFILRQPHGYETVVGQRGVNLSGGQKQRLAIARALLPKPRVLILDDSTSAVDVHTEARIHEAILAQGFVQTRFIVAQRISTVYRADRILVLEDGEIVGDGTHERLLADNAVYREIYESQTQSGVMIHE